MAFSVGIDLGTTNTVVSTARVGLNGAVEVTTEKITQVSENWEMVEDPLLASILYVDQGERIVGKRAKSMKDQNTSRVIFNSKNFIGDETVKWCIDDQVYTPELVASYFLSAVRKHLLSKYNNEESLKSAVITVPASFELDQKNATINAAKMAGFDESIVLISEPTAAMLDFINEQMKIEDEHRDLDFSEFRKVLVFDLGGGTCDVAVLSIKMQGKEIHVEELGVSQHTLVGGTNFDIYALNGVIADYEKEHNVSLKQMLTPEAYTELQATLNVRLEQAKVRFAGQYFNRQDTCKDYKKLTQELKVPIQIPYILNGNPFKFELTMERYNEYIQPLLSEDNANENIITPIEDALRASGCSKDGLDYIFCVGGMTQYPEVKTAVMNHLERPIYGYFDTMTSVSRGASIYHHYKIVQINGNHADVTLDLVPALPQSIYVGVKDDFPQLLIKEGTKAGTPYVFEPFAKISSEIGVHLEIYSGLSHFDPKLKRLKGLNIAFPHGVPAGSDISLKVEYTNEGVLNIETWLTEDKSVRGTLCLVGTDLTAEDIAEMSKEYGIQDVGGMCVC